MKQDYRLLVLDLDGTLTNSKREISPRNLRTLLRLQQSGVRLVLASGRPTYGIVPLAEQLQMKENNGYILSYNGGEIIDWSTGELLYKNLLPDDVLPILYQTATDNQQTILTYDNECILTENPNIRQLSHTHRKSQRPVRTKRSIPQQNAGTPRRELPAGNSPSPTQMPHCR